MSTGAAGIRVAFINNFAPMLGGGEVQLLTLLRGLSTSGVSSTLVCVGDSRLAEEAGSIEGVSIVPATFTGPLIGSMSATIAEKLSRPHVVQGTGFLTNVVARGVGARVGAGVVNTLHVIPGAETLDDEGLLRALIRRTLDRSSRDRVDRFVAVSQAVADGAITTGVNRALITIIRNGLDIERLRESAECAARPPHGRIRVGFLGRLEPIKGCEYYVRAVAKLHDQNPEVDFVVIGDGSARPQLERLSEKLGIASRLMFLGYVDNAAAALKALDVAVVPSLSEASGLTAIEASALGVPVVATRVGGLPEVVVDGETGLLVPPRDPDAIASAVSQFLDHPGLAHRLADNGRQRVQELFSAERMVAEYVDMYRGLLG